MEEKRKRWRER